MGFIFTYQMNYNFINDKSACSVQNEMLGAFDRGGRKTFFDLWTENIHRKGINDDMDVHKLEFHLNVYFAIFARKHGIDVSMFRGHKHKRFE